MKRIEGHSLIHGQSIWAPAGAKFLHAGMQYETLTVWLEVDTSQLPEPLCLHVYETGWNLPLANNKYSYEHRATVVDGDNVWHVYEEVKAKLKHEPTADSMKWQL